MIVNSAVPVCFSSSVCICTLKFFGKTHLHIWCFFCRLVHLHLHARRPWVTKHWSQSLYSSCFLAQMYTHAHTLIHTGHRRQTHTYIHTYMHKHILNTHTLSLRSCLCAFSPFFNATSRESEHPDCSSCLSRWWWRWWRWWWRCVCGGWGGGETRITMCDTTSVSTRSEFQIKRTPFFYQHSLTAANVPPPPPPAPAPPPPPPFSQIWSLSTPLLCPTPPASFPSLPLAPPSPPPPPFFPSVCLSPFLFRCTKCFKFIICILWCMGTIMFFIMEKWERFIFVTGLFHNSFFKLVL